MRTQISKEINIYKKKFSKLEYGISKKDEELQHVKNQQTATLEKLKSETERVLAKQRARICELETDNAVLKRKNKRKSKKVKKFRKMFLDDSDSSSEDWCVWVNATFFLFVICTSYCHILGRHKGVIWLRKSYVW